MFYSINHRNINTHNTQYHIWNKDTLKDTPWCTLELDGPSVYITVLKQGSDFIVLDTGTWWVKQKAFPPELEVPPFVEVVAIKNLKGPKSGNVYEGYVYADVILKDLITQETGVVGCLFNQTSTKTAHFSEDGNTLKISRTTLGFHEVKTYNYKDIAWHFPEVLRASHYDLPSGETSKEAVWGYFLKGYLSKVEFDDRGVKKVEDQYKETLNRLKDERPYLYQFFRFLHSGASYNKTTNNRLIAVFLEKHGSDYEMVV